MKFLFVLAFAFCGICSFAAAQTGASAVVKGTVTDSANAASLAYVTVSLREAGKTEALKSTYSKENGEFQFAGLAFKPYEVIISYVGYQTRTIKVESLSAGNPVADLKQIKLQSNTKQLKEVEVTAQKILVTQDIDKISYDVEADPESKTNTALDMLRKVPMVTVDADDNIQLKGSSSYRVLVNGKSSALFVRNPKDVLKTMPAASIKRIEVITNPPAKYEAEGVGGIINIITTKKTPAGYNGSVSGNVRYPKGYNGNAYLTVKTGKLGFSGSYGANAWYPPTNTSSFTRHDLVQQTILEQTGESTNHGRNHYSSAELSYEIDTLNLLTANFSFYRGSNDISQTQQNISFDSAGRLTQQFARFSINDDGWAGNDLGLDYQHTFRKNEEQLFTLSYKFNRGQDNSLANFRISPELNAMAQQVKTNNESGSREHTVQADYVHPFGKNTFEVGLKSITRLNQSDYFYSLLNPATGVFEIDPLQTNEFDYRQDIYAGYTSVSLKHNDWGLKVGARLEETLIDANFKSSETVVQPDYLNLVPSVALSRKLKEGQDMKLSYNQRIERPGLWYLNPYVNRTDPKNISYGNPNLKPATSHAFDLAHSAFIKTSSINTSLYYTFTNNSIQQFSFTSPTNPDVVETTYGNIGKEKNVGLALSTNLNPTNKLNLNLNSGLTYTFLTGFLDDLEVENSGLIFSIYGFGSYKFEKNWRLSANVGYNSGSVLLQGHMSGYFHHSLTLNKTFLKNDKATASLSVTSPFQKQRSWVNEINDPTFTQMQESIYQMRRISIGFTYKFGQLKGGIASKKRGIENDDVKGDKSGGGN